MAAVGFDELEAAMRKAADGAGSDVRERLNAAGVAYVLFAADHPALFRVMFGPELPRRGSPALEQSSRAAFQILRNAARAAVDATSSDGEELSVVTTAAWSVVHGLALLWLDGHLTSAQGDITELAERVTAFVSQALERR